MGPQVCEVRENMKARGDFGVEDSPRRDGPRQRGTSNRGGGDGRDRYGTMWSIKEQSYRTLGDE